MTLRLRDLTDDERTEVQRITRSHTLGAAFVRRAQIVVHAMSGLKAEEIARRMDLCGNTVRHWINRFNARGLDGLEEDVRTGRPPTYSAEQRSAVITAALTRPAELGLPFASWIGWWLICGSSAFPVHMAAPAPMGVPLLYEGR
jgi:hypothetical protein